MRLIKLGIISIVVFFLLLTAISLLLPSQINISRAININAPAERVYSNINDVSKWKNWYADYDVSKVSLSEKTVGKGASVTMERTKVMIRESSPGNIKAVWQMADNTPLPGEFNIFSQDSSSQITVQWLFVQKVKWYPWQKFALIMSDKSIGPFMEKSLDNLRSVSESEVIQNQ